MIRPLSRSKARSCGMKITAESSLRNRSTNWSVRQLRNRNSTMKGIRRRQPRTSHRRVVDVVVVADAAVVAMAVAAMAPLPVAVVVVA